MKAPEELVQIGMRCACCRRNIRTLYTYSVICDSPAETFLAVLCAKCWSDLVDPRIYKRLRSFMARIRNDTDMGLVTNQAEAPRSSP